MRTNTRGIRFRSTIAVWTFAALMGACATADAGVAKQRPTIVLQIPGASRRLPVKVRRPVPRRRPAPRAPARPAPVVIAPPAQLPSGADRLCLDEINRWGIPYRAAGTLQGVTTPIEITGAIRGVHLVPRAGRAPIMDCALALALAEAAPIFRRHGITALSYSGTYSYRNVRGTSHLSGHAFGLAIDVHGFETTGGPIEVERDFPKDAARWGVPHDNVAGCTGQPAGMASSTVRALACELRSSPAFKLIMSPDDNYDHRNHLHIEAYPTRSTDLLSYSGDKPAVVHRGRLARHR